MRIIFAGTPEFAHVAMARLIAAGHEIVLVLTQPDRPAGRGMKLQASAVKQLALLHNIPVAQPRSLRLDGRYPLEATETQTLIHQAGADVAVVAAYGLILPLWTLHAPRLGCLNIHASLLPRWRGAAPIHRAIEAGDQETGVTIMQMDAGLDTGNMLLSERLAISDHDSTASLHDRLATLGGQLIVQALSLAEQGALQPIVQPDIGITYAHKIEKHEAPIDWKLPAQTLHRRIRAFNPFPGANTTMGDEVIKVWAARCDAVAPKAAFAGQVLQLDTQGIAVQTGQGQLILTELQRAGGKRLNAANFLHGFALHVGDVLGH